MTDVDIPEGPYLTGEEVGRLFRVDSRTVNRWARSGRLTSLRTLGGHRRYLEPEVHRLLAAQIEHARPEPAA